MSGPAVATADEPNTAYLLQAACRIAQCMGQAFAAYLPRLLPLVLSLAELDPKLQMDAHEGDDAGDDEAAVVQIKGLGKMRASARPTDPTPPVPDCACACPPTFIQERHSDRTICESQPNSGAAASPGAHG